MAMAHQSTAEDLELADSYTVVRRMQIEEATANGDRTMADRWRAVRLK
jgi:hypothetical protein